MTSSASRSTKDFTTEPGMSTILDGSGDITDFRLQPTLGYPPSWQRVSDSEECREQILNVSSTPFPAGCPAEWEPWVDLCWPQTPRGYSVKVPCPLDLNPKESVYRYCTTQGSWYVNASFDSTRAYSDFYDCFLPVVAEEDDSLRRHANAQTVVILKALYDHRLFHSLLNGVSFLLMLAAFVICILCLRRSRTNIQYFKYWVYIMSIVALFINLVTSMSTKILYDSSYIAKCRIAKSLVSFTNIVFCECLLAIVFVIISLLLDYNFRRRVFQFALGGMLAAAAILVSLELAMEVFYHDNNHCGFGTSQSTYQWVITAPKFGCLACAFCMDSVVLHGVFLLKPIPKHIMENLKSLRMSGVCVFIMAVLNCVSESLLALLHHSASVGSSHTTIQTYTHAFAAVSAARGIFFSILIVYLDSGTRNLSACCSSYSPELPSRRTSHQSSEDDNSPGSQVDAESHRPSVDNPRLTVVNPHSQQDGATSEYCQCGGDEDWNHHPSHAGVPDWAYGRRSDWTHGARFDGYSLVGHCHPESRQHAHVTEGRFRVPGYPTVYDSRVPLEPRSENSLVVSHNGYDPVIIAPKPSNV